MPEPLPPYAQEWMAQWRNAAEELPKIRDRELRSMTDMQIIENAIALEPARPYPLRAESGMVVMQQWFQLLRTANEL